MFNEPFGPTTGQLPTLVSTADGPWTDRDTCLNGRIILDTNLNPTHMLHHNTAVCAYAPGQAVWRNVTAIPVEPGRTYIFSYRSSRLNTVSDPVLSQAVVPNAGGSVTVLSTVNPAWQAPGVWVSRQVVFRAGAGTTSLTLRVNNANTVANGNDFVMDDMVLLATDADLSITKDDGQTQYTPGGTVNYTIVVSNDGPADVTGAQVSDPLPTGISTASWTCSAAGGGTCGAASGTGGIATTADLPAGTSVTYTLSMTVPIGFSGNLTNTATVTAPAGVTEINSANNQDSDTDTQFTSPPGPGPGACNIATNGSFESPNIQAEPQRAGENTAYANGYAVWRTTTYPIDGWQTVAGTVDFLRHYNNASHGAQSLDLFGTAAATFRQTFTGLVPGQSYSFSIDYSGHSTLQAPGLVQLGNGAGATPVTIASLRPAVDSISNGTAGIPNTPAYSVTWSTFRYTFVAADTEATIQFVETGTGSTGLFIDNFIFAGDAPCEADLSITKDDGVATYTPGLDTSYTIVVSNNGPGPVGAAQINDPLPAGITNASWTCGNATGGGVCGAASGTGGINTTANLPVGASVTYTLTMGIPGSYSANLVNTATVTAPTGVTEIDDSNNSASDTDTMESPPTSSACSPRNVVPAMSFTLAPFPTTGTTDRTGAPNGWNPDNPWSTLGGNYTLTWNFSQPIPVEWLQFALVDIDTASPNGTLTISLGGGVPTSQIVKLGGDLLINSSGVVRRNSAITDDPGQSATFGFAPGGTVTWIRITSANIANIDHIGHRLLVRPSCLTISKVSEGGTGSFQFNMANVVQANGTAVPSTTLTTTTAGTPVASPAYNAIPGTDLVLNEVVPVGWSLASAICTDGNAGGTGNPTVIGSLTTPALTIPGNNVRPESDIQCRFSNAVAAPALEIDKTGSLNDLDGDGLIDLGETISYTFLVTNTGNVTLTDVTVDDQLLGDAGVSISPDPVTLAPNGTATFTATYAPTQDDIDAGSVTNTATGTGIDPGGNPIDSPPDSTAVPPEQMRGLSIDKTGTLNDGDGDGLIDPGETITYTFLVTNTGTVTMTNVTPIDPLLADNGIAVLPGPQTLAPNASATFTATYTPTQDDIDNGSVANTATAEGTDPDGVTSTSPPDTATVPPDQTPRLTVDKIGTLNDLDGDRLIDLGETISYSFRVTNSGTVTMTNVTVRDPLLTENGISVTPGPVTLGPGGSITFTATYAPDQADIDAGSVTNTATGTGIDPDGDTFESPPDTVTVPPDQAQALSIDKTGTLNDLDGDGRIDPGESITYTFVVTNTGQVTMTNVTARDPLLTDAGISVTPDPVTLSPSATATFTATYAPTQADIDAGQVENTATGTGTGPDGTPTESPPDSITVPPEAPSLRLEKGGRFNDVDGNGHASPGDTLTYTFTATNNGGRTVADVLPQDPGPTFNGRPAGAPMSDFTPGPVTLSPGEHTVFTATYTLTEDDIANAGAVPDGIVNSATLRGLTGNGVVTSEGSTSIVTMPAAAPGNITVTKVADLRRIYRGQQAPFTIRVTNNSPTMATDLVVVDTMPSGFRYVDGSASVDGLAVIPEIAGLRVRLTGLTVPGNSEIVIRLRMLALSSAGPGDHVNRAHVEDASGNRISAGAQAVVEIMAEPVFDCGDIIGRVFDDENRNGYQDDGELGLPGVRVATVNGWLVTTDAHGRFHVPCAALPDQRIGSNFIMKVDARTLPTGYRLTTENPRVVRLTAGKMTELNFGASIGRVVRLDLQDAAFEPGRIELREQWAQGLDQLIAFLAVEQSVLRLTYLDPGGDVELAQERLEHLSDLIGDRWRQTSGQYRLDIETRVETGQ